LHDDRDSLNEKRRSRSTPLEELMRRSRALRRSTAELLITPAFSIAIGWKKYDGDETEYLLIFLISSSSAGAPASHVTDSIYTNPADSRNVPYQGFAGTPRLGADRQAFFRQGESGLLDHSWLEYQQKIMLYRLYHSELGCLAVQPGLTCTHNYEVLECRSMRQSTSVRFTDIKANCNSHCLIVQPKTT